jgi:hypothetical protein
MVWFPYSKTVLCRHKMKERGKKYTFFQKISSVFLILTLCWLTVSAPFVAACQQQLAKQQKVMCDPAGCEDEANESDAGNNIEEKVPGATNLAEEFLHHSHTEHHFISIISLHHKLEDAGSYTAFHGELLVPPPNQPYCC